MIKRAWLNDDGQGNLTLCIRMTDNSSELRMKEMELPPTEPQPPDGRLIGLEMARVKGLSENHYVISHLSYSDAAIVAAALARILEA